MLNPITPEPHLDPLQAGCDKSGDSVDLFFNVVNYSPDSIVIVDAQGVILYANPKSEELFGRPVAELVGSDFGFPLVSEETIDIDLLNTANKPCVAQMRVGAVEWSGQNAWLATLRDITAQIQLSSELQQSNKELEDFALVVAHEIKAPLRTLHTISGWLLDDPSAGINLEALEDIRMMRKTSSRMQRLVDDLLSYSRIGRNSQPMKRVSLNYCVQEALDSLQAEIFDREADVTYEQLPVLACDAKQLVRLFQHVIGNAISYCEDQPRVNVASTSTSTICHVTIKDNGVGIKQSHLADIMSPFHHLHTSDEHDRVGIGLATCKKIMDYHQGKIWLESDGQAGTTVHLKFPISK